MGARFSAPVQNCPGAHPASCKMGTGSFPGVNRGRGVTLTPHPLLVPWSRKSRAVPLLPLWAVQPVQSLSACTRVNFTFYKMELCLSSKTNVSSSSQDISNPFGNRIFLPYSRKPVNGLYFEPDESNSHHNITFI